MNWNDAIYQVIDLKTFSNVWFWLAITVTWSTLSHWVLGVPYDMIARARRRGGDEQHDLESIVAINVRRLQLITEVAGQWMIGFVSFVLAGLATMGFYFQFELAQGVFCIGLPVIIVAFLNVRLSRRFSVKQPTGEDLVNDLLGLRFWIQVLAMISIFSTAMYGMYHNLSLPVGF